MSVRFAPSPTGVFHIGNLRTAWIAQHLAIHLNLSLHIRFEDIDKPRVVATARAQQLNDLKELGINTSHVTDQSVRHAHHQNIFSEFIKNDRAYPCDCTRKELQQALEQSASAPHQAFPTDLGRCRNRKSPLRHDLPSIAWRLRGPNPDGSDDIIIARTSSQTTAEDIQGFVPAYNFACAIDDCDDNHTLLVRAWDLAEMSDPQRLIQNIYCQITQKIFKPAAIFHTSLVVNHDGSRLEKRTRGVTLSELAALGYSSQQLLTLFLQSFQIPPNFHPKPSELLGETVRKLTLTQLLQS